MKGGMNYGRKSRWQPEKSTYKQQMHPHQRLIEFPVANLILGIGGRSG
jgi:hypothetical protein